MCVSAPAVRRKVVSTRTAPARRACTAAHALAAGRPRGACGRGLGEVVIRALLPLIPWLGRTYRILLNSVELRCLRAVAGRARTSAWQLHLSTYKTQLTTWASLTPDKCSSGI